MYTCKIANVGQPNPVQRPDGSTVENASITLRPGHGGGLYFVMDAHGQVYGCGRQFLTDALRDIEINERCGQGRTVKL